MNLTKTNLNSPAIKKQLNLNEYEYFVLEPTYEILNQIHYRTLLD